MIVTSISSLQTAVAGHSRLKAAAAAVLLGEDTGAGHVQLSLAQLTRRQGQADGAVHVQPVQR